MERRRRNRLTILVVVLVTAGSFVGVVFFGLRIGDRPGLGLVPLLLFVGWLLLARYLLGAAERLRAENRGRYPSPPGVYPPDSGANWER